MPEIDEALTRRVAELANLDLTAEEVAAYTRQVAEIIGYVNQLREVNVDGVEVLAHPLDAIAPFREDVVVDAPRAKDGQPRVGGGFRVPQVV